MSIHDPLLIEIPERNIGEGEFLTKWEKVKAHTFYIKLKNETRQSKVDVEAELKRLLGWTAYYEKILRLKYSSMFPQTNFDQSLYEVALAIRVLTGQYNR